MEGFEKQNDQIYFQNCAKLNICYNQKIALVQFEDCMRGKFTFTKEKD